MNSMLKIVAPLGVAAVALLTLAAPSLAQESTADDSATDGAAAEVADTYVPLASDGGLGTGVYDDDTYEGAPDAPIVLIEYASLTCPHCAAFHEQGYPELKPYIDAGQLVYVYRDFPLDGAAYRAALSARCLQGEAFFGAIDALFTNQRDWRAGGSEADLAREISALTGQTEDEYKACVGDADNQKKLIDRYNTAIDLGVDGTPRIYINGELYTPNRGWAQIGDEIARLVKKLKV
jgi:protein-disulfide isomerase